MCPLFGSDLAVTLCVGPDTDSEVGHRSICILPLSSQLGHERRAAALPARTACPAMSGERTDSPDVLFGLEVVTLIGLTLVRVGMITMAGGPAARADGTFGSKQNLALAGLVLIIIVVLNRSRNLFQSGIATGGLIAIVLNLVLPGER